MFSFAPELDHVPLALDEVLELHVSVNRPQIAAEGLDAQEAHAFFVSGHGGGRIEAFIYLKMLTSSKALLYRWRGDLEKSDYPEVREAAIQFTESMGFMMEDMQFRRVADGEKRRLSQEYGVFAPLASAEKQSAVEAEEVVVLEPAPSMMLPEESILDLSLDAPSTQVGFEAPPRQPETSDVENPLDDKNFKVFLRLLTSA
jgi:hypothetical protein